MPQAFNNTPNSDVIVDDTRLDLIHYLGTDSDGISSWYPRTPEPNAYNNTYTQTRNTSLLTYFPRRLSGSGTRVAVYGSVESSRSTTRTVLSRYAVNQSFVSEYSSVFAPQDDHVLFYQSGDLPFGEWTHSEAPPTSTSTGTSSSQSLSTSRTSGVPEQSGSPAQVKPSISPGAIAGYAVAGGVALVLAAVLLVVLYRRRKQSGVRVIIDDEGDFIYGRPDVEMHESSPNQLPRGSPDSAEGQNPSFSASSGIPERDPLLVPPYHLPIGDSSQAVAPVRRTPQSEKLRRELETRASGPSNTAALRSKRTEAVVPATTHGMKTSPGASRILAGPPDLGGDSLMEDRVPADAMDSLDAPPSTGRAFETSQRRASRFSENFDEDAPPAYVP